jgi:hypothetical protein
VSANSGGRRGAEQAAWPFRTSAVATPFRPAATRCSVNPPGTTAGRAISRAAITSGPDRLRVDADAPTPLACTPENSRERSCVRDMSPGLMPELLAATESICKMPTRAKDPGHACGPLRKLGPARGGFHPSVRTSPSTHTPAPTPLGASTLRSGQYAGSWLLQPWRQARRHYSHRHHECGPRPAPPA